MSYSFDFGLEGLTKSFEESAVTLLFAADGDKENFSKSKGPLAVADASCYAEFFDLGGELLPMAQGVYAEVTGGPDPVAAAVSRASEAIRKGKLPVIVSENRRVASEVSSSPLVALWGKIGRDEFDETDLLRVRETLIIGARAATSKAFEAMSSASAVITSRALSLDKQKLKSTLNKIAAPVHLSVDLDVLAPSVALGPRSVEPGGLSWYDLQDAIDAVFEGPGVASVDLLGTAEVEQKSPAALLCAQILLKIAGAAAKFSKR